MWQRKLSLGLKTPFLLSVCAGCIVWSEGDAPAPQVPSKGAVRARLLILLGAVFRSVAGDRDCADGAVRSGLSRSSDRITPRRPSPKKVMPENQQRQVVIAGK